MPLTHEFYDDRINRLTAAGAGQNASIMGWGRFGLPCG